MNTNFLISKPMSTPAKHYRLILWLMALLAISGNLFAADPLNQFIKITDGLSFCTPIGSAGTTLNAKKDDFKTDNYKIGKLLHKNGEMYAFIDYVDESNYCGGNSFHGDGMFRFDTIQKKWYRVSYMHPDMRPDVVKNDYLNNDFSNYVLEGNQRSTMLTNGKEIMYVTKSQIWLLTTDYANHPSGWKLLNTDFTPEKMYGATYKDAFKDITWKYYWSEIDWNPGAFNNNDLLARAFIGDTLFLFQTHPTNNAANMLIKYNIKENTWSRDIIGALPHSLFGITNTDNMNTTIVDHIGGRFVLFVAYPEAWRDIPHTATYTAGKPDMDTNAVRARLLSNGAYKVTFKGTGELRAYYYYMAGGNNDFKTDDADYVKINKYLRDTLGAQVSYPYEVMKEPYWEDGREVRAIWAYDLKTGTWKDISLGYKSRDTHGGAFGGATIETTWNQKSLIGENQRYVSQWNGDGWELLLSGTYDIDGRKLFTTNAVFIRGRNGTFKFTKVLKQQVGEASASNCLSDNGSFVQLWTPNDGRSLYTSGPGSDFDPYNGSMGCDNEYRTGGIYKLQPDPFIPGSTVNLHLNAATYLGGNGGENMSVGVGVNNLQQVLVGGNYPEVKGRRVPGYSEMLAPAMNGVPAATPSNKARILRMSTNGDSLISVLTLPGNKAEQMQMQNFGQNRIIISGDWGITCVNKTATQVLWSVPRSTFNGVSGENDGMWEKRMRASIDDNGHVAVLLDQYLYAFDENGNQIGNKAKMISLTPMENFHCIDACINNDTVYIVGWTQHTACGNPVQQGFVYAYRLTSSSPMFLWKDYQFPKDDLCGDMADSRMITCNIGQDGKLYVGGHTAGGNTLYRWNGKERDATNTGSIIVSGGDYGNTINTMDPWVGFVGKLDRTTGVVEYGAFLTPRKPWYFNKNNNCFIESVQANAAGYVFVGMKANNQTEYRDLIRINGKLVGDNDGMDLSFAMLTPNLSERIFWGTFSEKEKASIKNASSSMPTPINIGFRDNIVAFAGYHDNGKMVTGLRRWCTEQEKVVWVQDSALNPRPFNYSPSAAKNGNQTIQDSYLAVWDAEIWKYAEEDTIERRIYEGDSIVAPECINNFPDFEADITTVCVGQPLQINNLTVSNPPAPVCFGLVEAMDDTAFSKYEWDFGPDALPSTAVGKGPFSISYSTPGPKTISVVGTLQFPQCNGAKVPYSRKNYITVMPTAPVIGPITGPVEMCEGTEAWFTMPSVDGIAQYEWTLPTGFIQTEGNQSNQIKVKAGQGSGTIKVHGVTPCGNTEEISIGVSVTKADPQNALFVVGAIPLSTLDNKIKTDYLELAPNNFKVITRLDNNVITSDAGCAAVVIFSPSADPVKVSTKFVDVTTPILTMNPGVGFYLGMTSNSLKGSVAGTSVNMIANGHEMQGTFGNGNLPVYTTSSGILWGKPSIYADTIATTGVDRYAIFGYEQGMDMISGISKGRKAAFFMADPTYANGDAKTLFNSTTCWLLSNCPNAVTVELNNPGTPKFCPGDSVTFTYNSTGTFSSTPTMPYSVTLDKPQYFDGYYDKVSYVDGSGNWASFIKYEIMVNYEGTYKLDLKYVPTSNIKVTCIVNDENGKSQFLVDQTKPSPANLGTYYFLKKKRYTVMLYGGYVYADDLVITGVDLLADGNRFIVQMSNANGDFSSPTDIGFVTTAGMKPIKTQIPTDASIGTNYQFRLKSTKPSSISAPISAFEVMGTPVKPNPIMGDANVCAGATNVLYQVNDVQGASYYVWERTNGAKFTNNPEEPIWQTGNSVKLDFSALGGKVDLIVRAGNNCGVGEKSEVASAMAININFYPPVTPNTVAGRAQVCKALTSTYNCTPVPEAELYEWKLGANGIRGNFTTTVPKIDINFAAWANGTDTIQVRTRNACGIYSKWRFMLVTVGTFPPVVDTIMEKQLVNINCKQSYRYTASSTYALPTDTWEWTPPGTATGSSVTNQIDVEYPVSTSGVVRVRMTDACGTSPYKQIAVNKVVDGALRAYIIYGGTWSVLFNKPFYDRLTSLGYQVDTISGYRVNASTNFDCYNVVVCPTSFHANTSYNSYLRNIKAPVILYATNVPDPGGVIRDLFKWTPPTPSNNAEYKNTNKIKVTDVNHPITKGLPAGLWDIRNNGQTGYITGIKKSYLYPFVMSLANNGADDNLSSLLYSEAGECADGGFILPNKRLFIASPEWHNLDTTATANYRTLFDNAVCWADPVGCTNGRIIRTDAVAQTSYCAGDTIRVSFTKIKGTFDADNVVTVEISDPVGKWCTKTVLAGTYTGAGSGTVNAVIPANFPAGKGYKVRVYTSKPNVRGSESPSTITISAPPTVNAGADQIVCSNSAQLGATTNPFGLNGTWSIASGGGAPVFSSTGLSNPTVSNMSANKTYGFRYTVVNGACTVSDTVNVTTPVTPVIADAGLDATYCDSTYTLMAVNPGAGFTGVWVRSNGMFGTITTPTSPNAIVKKMMDGIAEEYTWTVTRTADGCTAFDKVTLIRKPKPEAQLGADFNTCVNDFSIVPISTLQTGQINYFTKISGNGTIESSTGNVTGLSSGASTFRYYVQNADASCQVFDDVVIMRKSKPVANAGADISTCKSFYDLNPVGALQTGETGTWSKLSGLGFLQNEVTGYVNTIDAVGSGTYLYTVSADGIQCVSSDNVNINRVVKINAGPDQSLCTSSTSMAASMVGVTSGSWQLVSGTGTITTPTSATTGITGLGVGTNVFRWIINTAAGCIDTAEVTLNYVGATPTANAGVSQYICSAQSTLNASGTLAGGRWSLYSGTGFISDTNSPTPTVSGMDLGYNVFKWTVGSGACLVSDTVTIRVGQGPTGYYVWAPSTTTCNSSLMIYTSRGSTYEGWSTNYTPGTLTSNHVNYDNRWNDIPSTTVNPDFQYETGWEGAERKYTIGNLQLGDNKIKYGFKQTPDGCIVYDSVVITRVSGAAPTGFTAGTAQTNCNHDAFMNATLGNAVNGRWEKETVAPSVSINEIGSPTSYISGLAPSQSVTFRWIVDNGLSGSCYASDTATVTLTRSAGSPPVINPGNDDTICGSTYTLVGTAPGATTTLWKKVQGAGTINIASPGNLTSNVTGLASGVSKFRLIASNGGGCIDSAEVTITVSNIPATAITTSPISQTICVGGTRLLIAGASGGNVVLNWYKNGTPLGVTGSTYEATTPGAYHVVAEGTCGSATSAPATLNGSSTMTITTHPTNKEICDGEAGSLTIAGTGITAYQWRKNNSDILSQTTNTLNFNPISSSDIGSYNVRVDGSCGSIYSNAANVTVKYENCGCADSTFAISVQPIAKNICENDTAMLSVTTIGTDLTYQWYHNGIPVGTDNDSLVVLLSQLTDSGFYKVKVSDFCNTRMSDSVKLTVGENAIIVNQPLAQTICQGDSLKLSVKATGIITEYQWMQNGVNIGTSDTVYKKLTVSITDTGFYKVQLTGACANVLSDSVHITINDTVKINTQPIAIDVCEGADTALSISATGTAIQYQWLHKGVATGIDSNKLLLPAIQLTDSGYYKVLVVGACRAVTTDSVLVKVKPNVNIVTQPVAQTLCQGDSLVLSIAATGSITGYQWMKNGVNIGSTDSVFKKLVVATTDTGYYRVKITGACSDVFSDSVKISVIPSLVATAQAVSTDVCEGKEINLNEIGGTATAWSWTGPNGFTSSLQAPKVENVTAADSGKYYVTISNGSCTGKDSVVINTDPLPVIVTNNDTALCTGGKLILTASGGTTHAWSGGVNNGVEFTPTSSAVYTVTVTSGSGCIQTKDVSVTVNDYPTLDVNNDTAICVGATVMLTASGGVTQVWDNGVNNGVAFAPLATQTYKVVVTSSFNCTKAASVTVTLDPLPSSTITVDRDTVNCANSIANISVPIGNGYKWSNGLITNSIEVSPISTTVYTVTVTSAKGCTSVNDTTIISEGDIPDASITATFDAVDCKNDSSVLAVPVAFKYKWSTGDSTQSITVKPLVVTTYKVTVTSLNGCSASSSKAIFTSFNKPTISSITADSVSCFGKTDGKVTVVASGVGLTYKWDKNPATIGVITNLAPEIYTVTVTGQNGCTATAIDTVYAPQLLSSVVSDSAEKCNGTATGKLWATTTGGTTPYFYKWQGSSVIADTLKNIGAGLYNVTVTDKRGCTVASSGTVASAPAITAFFATQTSPKCYDGNDGELIVNALGGTGLLSYNWSTTNGEGLIDLSPSQSSLKAGDYTVIVKDAYLCEKPLTATLTQPVQIVITPTPTHVVCKGLAEGEITLTVTNAVGTPKYTWTGDGVNPTDKDQDSLKAGIYKVIVEDDINCKSPLYTIEITQPTDSAQLLLTPTHFSCFGSDEAGITATVVNSNGSETYTWSDSTGAIIGGNISMINVARGGWYYLDVSLGACNVRDSVEIIEPNEIVVNVLKVEHPMCDLSHDGLIEIEFMGGDGNLVATWSTGDVGRMAQQLSPGDYTVTVSDFSCEVGVPIQLIVQKDNCVTIPTAFSPNGDGSNDVWRIDLLHEFYPESTIQVFNRNGVMVYSSKGYNKPWDGTYNGVPLPVESYHYIINFNGGNRKNEIGQITIVR